MARTCNCIHIEMHQYMFDFQLKYCKSTFNLKASIEFFLGKHTFRPQHTFATENQTCPDWGITIAITSFFRCGSVVLEDVIVRVPTACDLANLSIPCELRIVALECPEPIGSHRVTPHLLRLLAPVLHTIHVLPESTIPFLWVFHHLQYQVLREFHYETHLLFSSLLFR